MNLRQYIISTIFWSLFCSFIIFAVVALAAQQFSLDAIAIDTGRFLALLVLINTILTLVLVKIQR